jgi:hypothetical protein
MAFQFTLSLRVPFRVLAWNCSCVPGPGVPLLVIVRGTLPKTNVNTT